MKALHALPGMGFWLCPILLRSGLGNHPWQVVVRSPRKSAEHIKCFPSLWSLPRIYLSASRTKVSLERAKLRSQISLRIEANWR